MDLFYRRGIRIYKPEEVIKLTRSSFLEESTKQNYIQDYQYRLKQLQKLKNSGVVNSRVGSRDWGTARETFIREWGTGIVVKQDGHILNISE